MALDQLYSTWESSRLINGESAMKADEKWRKGLLKKDEKWRKQVAADVGVSPESAGRLARIAALYEDRTLPLWRAACKAWYDGFSAVGALRLLSVAHSDEFGSDAVRLTVSNLYEAAKSPPSHLALYWKDSGRKYKVTRRERHTGALTCPRCRGAMKPRTYRHQKKCLQCRGCGFAISPKDLLWDAEAAQVQPDTASPQEPME